MKTVTDLPYDIIEEENVWVPVTDGLHLAARIWRPRGSNAAPVPAILEYIPYRKRFDTALRDAATHTYLAGHGYACIRLDIRGSGESEGVLTDEYLQSELDDGVAAIAWIAAQDWCDGNVGMMGISWGGFNSLQIAAERPEALKAIVSVCASDDRYADDIHYMGGVPLTDQLSWASVMFSFNTLPPDPALVGPRWREMWHERLEGSGLWLETWLRHQTRDAFWRHGSICENYGAVDIPVFAVSGWADGYTNAVFRLMENLSVPRKGLVGPWAHTYPHYGYPGPAIDFLGELLRWWDRWLKGRNTGVETDPTITAYMLDSAPPKPAYEHRDGRWVAERHWPAPEIEDRRYALGSDLGLHAGIGQSTPARFEVCSPVTLGLEGGKWCSYGNAPDQPGDQRAEDGGALVFETAPLRDAVEILGPPRLDIDLASDRPRAMIAVRLSDVRPDGGITRVSYGLLNLPQREGHALPDPLRPNESYRVRVALNHIAQRFPAGHRIRISISTSYWPLAWTPPEDARLTVITGTSFLALPVRTPRPADGALDLGEPVAGPECPATQIEPADHRWFVHRDLDAQTTELTVIDDRGTYRLEDIDLTTSARATERYAVRDGAYASAEGTTEWTRRLARGDWQIGTRTRTVLRADEENFHIDAELRAFENDRCVDHRGWHITLPRQ